MIPRHVNPANSDRVATAPYNFVPLPEKILTVEEGIVVNGSNIKPWERHNESIPGTASGWIDLEITTLTPLYIRGPRRHNGQWDERDNRLRPEPYATLDGRPVIPGSSLRGAIRTLVEILGFAKIHPVSRARPFFRDISTSRISAEYRKFFIEDLGPVSSGTDIKTKQPTNITATGYGTHVRAGFVDASRRSIRECGVARIEQQLIVEKLSTQVYSGSGPICQLQHLKVNVKADLQPRDYFFCRKVTSGGKERHCNLYLRLRKVQELSTVSAGELQAATLVITGGIPNKHLEFAFLHDEGDQELRIPDSIWTRFHDDDQTTFWQERAFPRDMPTRNCRKRPGHLRDGEPVFFLTDDAKKSEENPDGLIFFGRAQLFRLPYDLSPEDLVPEAIRDASLDLAEAVFGRVGRVKGMESEALKGRVFFEDAVAALGGAQATLDVFEPRILSSPKPTTFQHYLTQDGSKGSKDLTTYFRNDCTAIRGHKLYWHRWDDSKGAEQARETASHGQAHDTQHTLIQPVKAGTTFNGRVRFENLTDVELGALLSAIQLPEGCAHKIGMGKSLGLGSAQILASLRLVDRGRRYENWDNDGVVQDDSSRYRDAFANAVLAHAANSGEALLAAGDGLRRVGRLDALFRMLEWRKRPAPAKTTAMELKTFRDLKRAVLPTPHRVVGAPEPPWSENPPRPGAPTASDVTHNFEEPRQASIKETGHRAMPARSQPKPIGKGQTRQGRLHRVASSWIARFAGDDRDATITNLTSIPAEVGDGAAGEFYIMEQSKKSGIRARFERLLP